MWSKTIAFAVLSCVIWANLAQAYPQGQGPSGPPPSGPPPNGPPPSGMPPKGAACGPPPTGNPLSTTTASSGK